MSNLLQRIQKDLPKFLKVKKRNLYELLLDQPNYGVGQSVHLVHVFNEGTQRLIQAA